MENSDRKAFGQRLKLFRRSMGLSQREFGKRCGLTQKTVCNMELGEKTPMYDNVTKIWEHFTRLSSDWLQKGEGDMLLKPGQLAIKPTPKPELLTEEAFVEYHSSSMQKNLDQLEKDIELRREKLEAQKKAIYEEQLKIEGEIDAIRKLRKIPHYYPG